MPDALPCLRSDLAFVEQVYRGERSWVVKDRSTQKYFRFGNTEVQVMRALDGQRTPQAVSALLGESGLRIAAKSIEAFARKLAAAGFLERTLAEKSVLQMERLRAERGRARRHALFRGELLRMRWSFGDPDEILGRALPSIRWMFTPGFLALSALGFLVYFIILGQGWSAYTAALHATYSLHTITIGNVVVFWVTALAVVLIHELGHGFTCKYFGGEVHELGFMLLYFQPAFYCNVTDAWSFPDRRSRLWVTAAGSWIQLVVASVAAVVWSMAAPGTLIAQVCVAAMLIGGVMTLLTNANPLLPLDGYFALTDWLEIPNLRHRAFAHLGWWIKRTVFRLQLPEPDASFRERKVFMTYGALAAAYIAFTFALIAVLVLGWAGGVFGGIGVAWAGIGMLLLSRRSLAASLRAAMLSLRTHRAALRAHLGPRRVAVAIGLLVLTGALVPWPLRSSGAFVVQPVTTGAVTPNDAGIVAQVFVSEGASVAAGEPLLQLADPALDRDLLMAGRVVDSLALAEAAARATGSAADAERLAASRRSAQARWTALEDRTRRLLLRAPIAGTVITARPQDLAGRQARPGDTLLVIAALDSVEARISLRGGGATRVHAGQTAHLVTYADVTSPWTGAVSQVSIAAATTGASGGAVEARVRLAGTTVWRPGARGEARVDLRRSSVLGALLWNVRQLLRTDVWL